MDSSLIYITLKKEKKKKIMSKQLFCERCSLQFVKKCVFDLHLSVVHGEKIEVKVESPICEENLHESQISGTKFSYEEVHEKEKSFKCNVCYVRFTRTSSLKHHMNSVHEGKKPFQCNTCDAKYARNFRLKEHMESVHEGKKPFLCIETFLSRCPFNWVFCVKLAPQIVHSNGFFSS